MNDRGMFGIDWDHDGKVSDIDDSFTAMMLDEEEKRQTGGQQGGDDTECCGVCLLWMLAIPAGAIGLVYGISRWLA